MKYIFLFFPVLLFGYYPEIDHFLKSFERKTTTVLFSSNIETSAFIKSHPNSQCIIFEDNNPRRMSKLDYLLKGIKDQKFETPPLVLHKRLYKDEMILLSSCEYFDLSIFIGNTYYTKAMGKNPGVIDSALALSKYTLIEAEMTSGLADQLRKRAPEKIYYLDNGNLFFQFCNNRSYLTKLHLLSCFAKRTISMSKREYVEHTTWNPFINVAISRPLGMNIVNYRCLNGVFPSSSTIAQFKIPTRLKKDSLCYFHEIYVEGNQFTLTSTKRAYEEERSVSESMIKRLCKMHKKKQINDLLYPKDEE